MDLHSLVAIKHNLKKLTVGEAITINGQRVFRAGDISGRRYFKIERPGTINGMLCNRTLDDCARTLKA